MTRGTKLILSDTDIRQAIKDKRILIDPVPPKEHFSPSALDLRVENEFKSWAPAEKGMEITFRLSDVQIPKYGRHMQNLQPDHQGRIVIAPDAFVLAKTLERIELPLDSCLAARVEGRSSYARLGLVVHMTAPTIHAGFMGSITLEMKNFGAHPLSIDPGKTCICQLIFEQLTSCPSGTLDSHFQGQSDVLGN